MSHTVNEHGRQLQVVLTVVLLVVSSTVAAVPVAADGHGELTIDVEHENGNRAQEVNALIIYQDGEHYRTVSNYPGVDLEHTFDNLPTGHDYRVNAYIHDQFAGSVSTTIGPGGFLNEPNAKSKTIAVENPVELQPQVYYSDGSTPLAGALVQVKSHEDDPSGSGKVVWRSATTTSDGRTDPSGLFLYPTESNDPGYYTVEVVGGDDTVASKRVDSLTRDTTTNLVTSESVPTYDLSASSTDGGDVDESPRGEVERGETVSVIAEPDDGYEFDHWSGDYPDGSRTDERIDVRMDGDKEVTAHFDKLEGDLTVDVRHQNGDRAQEVNGLVVWQDEVGGEPFRKFSNYPSVAIRQRINDLPGGHEYRVNAYVNDQYAGTTGWVGIEDSDVSRTITVDDPVTIEPRVYYSNGETPLAGAEVRVRSHEDDPDGPGRVVWRSATTTDDGTTDPSRLFLHPTESDEPGYYTVEAVVDGRVVASERLDSLTSDTTTTLVTSESAPTNEVWFTVSKQSSLEGYEFSGETISGATVSIAGQSKQTGDDGRVQFELPTGSYEYRVSADGFESLSDTADVPDSGALTVSVPLTRTGAGVLELDVVGRDGSSLAANTYRVLVDGERVTPNAEGELVVEDGSRTVTIEPTEFGREEGVTRVEQTVQIEAGKRTQEEIAAVRANRPSIESVSVEVRSMNGNSRQWNGFEVGSSIKEMRVALTGPEGNPVTVEEIRLGTEDSDRTYTLTHTENGVYKLDAGIAYIFADTEYTRLAFSYPDSSGRTSVSVPTVADRYGLRAPIEGWVARGSARVTVDGQEYVGVKLTRDGDYESSIEGWSETAWIVFDSDGTLVTDPELREKAALTAMVASSTERNSEWMVEFLKEEYPNTLERQLQYAQIGSGMVLVRDTAAELLGTVAGAVATGGGNIVSKTTVKGAVKATAKQLSKDLLVNYLKSEIPGSEIRTNPMGAIQKALKLQSRAEIRDAVAESREAGRILERHSSGRQWDYESASEYYESKNESITDGSLYAELRMNMLPSGDPRDQLVSVTKSVATGATGVPVDTLTSLIEDEQMGYISDSIEETGRTRAVAALQARSFRQYSAEAQQQASETHQGRVLYSEPGETVKSARISLVEAPSGGYTEEQRANATVAVTNTGDTTARFFVGYSAATTVDGERQYFDNYGTTGHFVELSPGESTETEVSWLVQSNAPVGQGYDAIVAVWPEFPQSGVEPYQTREQTDAFRVVEGTDFETTSVSVAESSATVGQQQLIVTEVQNTGSVTGSTVVNLTVDGTVVEQRVVEVSANSERSVLLYHTFDQAGRYTVESGSEQTSVTVDSPEPTASFTTTTAQPAAETTTEFDASDSRVSAGTIDEYRWDFDGDGETDQTTQTPTVTHSFPSSGEYPVTLTVVAGDQSTTTTRTIAVNAAPSGAVDARRSVGDAPSPGGTVEVTVTVQVDGEVDELRLEPEFGPLTVVEQSATPTATFDSEQSQWLWATPVQGTVNVTYVLRVPTDATDGQVYALDGRVSGAEIETVQVRGESTVEVKQCVGGAVAGTDGQIGLREVQRLVDAWQRSETVAGESVGLRQLQRLVDAWQQGESVSCGVSG